MCYPVLLGAKQYGGEMVAKPKLTRPSFQDWGDSKVDEWNYFTLWQMIWPASGFPLVGNSTTARRPYERLL